MAGGEGGRTRGRRRGPDARKADEALEQMGRLALREHSLQSVLQSVADLAKGIFMERFKVTADQAFQALARVSMHRNTKLRDVADRLVRAGEFPLE